MKKYIHITALVLVLPLLIFSCDSSSNNPTQSQEFKKISKIKNDSVFTHLFSNTYTTLTQVKDPQLAKKLSSKGKDLTAAEKEKLAKALGFNSKKAFIQNYKNYQKAINYLNVKYNYSSYSQEKITSLAMESPIVQKSVAESTSLFRISNDCESNCKRIAKDKTAKATAGAIIGHVGCAAADLIWIGVACHAAVIVGQAAVSDQAYAEMKQCIHNCK